jgi:hypothetical protein
MLMLCTVFSIADQSFVAIQFSDTLPAGLKDCCMVTCLDLLLARSCRQFSRNEEGYWYRIMQINKWRARLAAQQQEKHHVAAVA